MTFTKNHQASLIGTDLLMLHRKDAERLEKDFDNCNTFAEKMSFIDKFIKDYENDTFYSIMSQPYKAVPARIKEARMRMLYTLLPNVSEVDAINLRVEYKHKAYALIQELETTYIENIYWVYDRYEPSKALNKVINNIWAKNIIFGLIIDFGKTTQNARLRLFLKAINSNNFSKYMNQYLDGYWNYTDEDINVEVIELFIRRLMSFTL